METSSLFRQHVIQHKWRYLFGIALLSISSLLQLWIPVLLKEFTDQLQDYSITVREVLMYALWLALVGFLVAFFRSTSRILLFTLARMLDKMTKRKLFQQWERLSSSYFDRQRIGDLMSHAINDVNVLREVAMQGVFMTGEAIVLIGVSVIAMGMTVDWGLTLLVVLPLPALTYLGYRFRSQIHIRATRVQEAISQLTSRVQEFCSGIRIVKTYVQEKDEIEKFTQDNEYNVQTNRELIKSNSMFLSVSQGIVGLSFLISIVFGGILVLNDRITLGEFVAFNTYLGLMVTPVENLGRVINTLQRGKAAEVRLHKVLSTQPEVTDSDDVLPLKSLQGDIRIRGLTFCYPESDKPALRDIDIDVPAGSSLAIVGRVGSGKTTLVQLLLRMYNPPPGTIFIDGHELRRIPLSVLRRSIGYVPQEYFLFSTTIAENIAFDPNPYGEAEIVRAAKIAQVHDNIIEFPQKFETRLGERGVSLSGGQRQRISMARALIKNPSILIFDDSLSAVDADTEERILQGLKQVMKGRTTIIVSHRISAIREADQIIVLDRGRIVERGRHDELVQLGGIYAKMHEQQQLNREMGE